MVFNTLMKENNFFETEWQIQDMFKAAVSWDTLWAMVNNSTCCSQILIGLFRAVIYDVIKFLPPSFTAEKEALKYKPRNWQGEKMWFKKIRRFLLQIMEGMLNEWRQMKSSLIRKNIKSYS